eukprot:2016410-Pleurochrysis_carterae.AAC.3
MPLYLRVLVRVFWICPARGQALEKLQLTWENVSFEFEQHRESDVYLLSMKDEDVESLEDNQLLVQGMMGSKCAARPERRYLTPSSASPISSTSPASPVLSASSTSHNSSISHF